MVQILTKTCTAEESGVLMRNSWRYARIGNVHVRIHPPTSDVSVLPPGQVRYLASIEVLAAEAAPWGRAEQEAIDAISTVFGSVLSGG
jgi:hypothetical protein